jgi:hypothetical protein
VLASLVRNCAKEAHVVLFHRWTKTSRARIRGTHSWVISTFLETPFCSIIPFSIFHSFNNQSAFPVLKPSRVLEVFFIPCQAVSYQPKEEIIPEDYPADHFV